MTNRGHVPSSNGIAEGKYDDCRLRIPGLAPGLASDWCRAGSDDGVPCLTGACIRVISRNGKPTRYRGWQDTVLMSPRERIEIAFVADNPGDWMFHCHIAEQLAGGMMGIVRVT